MAITVTPADIRNFAPEFDSAELTDPRIQIYIDMADGEINEDAWGSRAKTAEILLTCHMLKMAGANASSTGTGPITGMSVGDVSVQYAAPQVSAVGLEASLAMSKYGLEYARLVKLAAFGAEVC
jgi:hypothetical protein